MELKLQRPLAFIDLETTGINIAKDRIVEISILKVMPDGNRHIKTHRMNPTIPIPPEVTAIHGISDADVQDEPTFADLADKLYIYLEGCDLAGYNSNRFDIPLLVEEFLRAGIDFSIENRQLVDVQRIFHQMEKRTLEAAYQFYCQKELNNAHSAEADVKATYEVLCSQLSRYEKELENDVAFLHDFSQEQQYVDLGRRIVLENGVELFNFGKHKGKPVREILQKEPGYYGWIMNGDFLQHTKKKLKEIKAKMDNK